MNSNIIKKGLVVLFVLFLVIIIFLSVASKSNDYLVTKYNEKESSVTYDRNNDLISIKPNDNGYYSVYLDKVPAVFKDYLLFKEDKYFHSHFGINPISTIRALINYSEGNENLSSSTLTQQLTKILLDNETDRNLKNKFIEAYYSIVLEIFNDKDEILNMYANSVYFGNKIQGLNMASKFYFGTSPTLMTDNENIQLVSTISSPSLYNPFNSINKTRSEKIAKSLGKAELTFESPSINEIKDKKEQFNSFASSNLEFEIASLSINSNTKNSKLSLDKDLNENIRDIVDRNIQTFEALNATNSAVVVIKYPENELLAIVGSPDPKLEKNGYKINMAISNRPIGSVVKPFIYVKGFEKGLRPYSLVDDKEYKYLIDSGYAFYPKNYDYKYRGIVSLHYALSNSLNVPTVKVLEYVGLNNFYDFLLNDLEIEPVQDLRNYQLGIALGQLEMDLLSLSYDFTIFANAGHLYPLNLGQNIESSILDKYDLDKQIVKPQYIELVNKILTDRKTGVEQFGLESEFNTFQDNIALKTGTSRAYHDSWIVGYTPDFLVAVWLGNSKNTPMKDVSGQSGAGKIWNEIMNLMLNSEYNKKTPFKFDAIEEYNMNNNIEYGLHNDNYEEHRNILLDDQLILSPHDGDTFLIENDTKISLKSNKNVKWYIDDVLLSEGAQGVFAPRESGEYEIKAVYKDSQEIVNITLEID